MLAMMPLLFPCFHSMHFLCFHVLVFFVFIQYFSKFNAFTYYIYQLHKLIYITYFPFLCFTYQYFYPSIHPSIHPSVHPWNGMEWWNGMELILKKSYLKKINRATNYINHIICFGDLKGNKLFEMLQIYHLSKIM